MVQYLLTRTLDPLFALCIGFTSAFLRIHREESARFLAAASTTNTSSPTIIPSQDLVTGSHETHAIEMGATTREGGVRNAEGVVGGVDGGLAKEGLVGGGGRWTRWDTWELIKKRVKTVDVRKWDVRDLWRQRDSWGVVEPNQVGRRGE